MHSKILIFHGDIAVWKGTFYVDGESGVKKPQRVLKIKFAYFGAVNIGCNSGICC